MTLACPEYGLRTPDLPRPYSKQHPCGDSCPGSRRNQQAQLGRDRNVCALSARVLHGVPDRDSRALLRGWAQVLGNMKRADAFFVTRSLRRSSNPSEGPHGSPALLPVSPAADSPGELKLRALVRPQAPKKPCTLIRHVFNIDELRAMLPATLPSTARDVRGPTGAHLSPHQRQFGGVQPHESLSPRAANRDTRPDGANLKRDPAGTPIRKLLMSHQAYQWLRRANRPK